MDIAKKLAFGRSLNAVAAGTSVQNGTAIDWSNHQGIVFIASFGAGSANAVTQLKAQQGAAANGSDAADLAGTGCTVLTPTTDDNKIVVLDVQKPTSGAGKYVRPVVLRATGNQVLDGVTYFLYGSTAQPATDNTNVLQKNVVISPALGTP